MTSAALRGDSKTFLVSAALFLIVVVGLYLRVDAVLNTVIDTPVRADARLYYFYSLNIHEHGTFSRSFPGAETPIPDAFVPPVYPLAITPFLEFPPTDKMVVHIGLAQALLGALTILFTFLLVQRVGGSTAGLLAASLTAISPHLVSLTTYMLTETLFTLFMMAGLLFAACTQQKGKIGFAVVAGVLLGLAALTRSTLEYFPFFLLIAVMLPFFGNIQQTHRRNLLLLALTALAVIVAWKIRNLISAGALSDPSLMIATLQSGMYPDLTFEGYPESRGIPYRFDPRNSEIASSLSSVLNEIASRFSSDPVRHLQWYLFGKPVALLSWSMIDGWGDIFVYPVMQSPYFISPVYQGTRFIMLMMHPALMIMGFVCSLIVLFRPRWLGLEGMAYASAFMMSLMAMYFILLHMIGAPFPRYGVPLRPVMYGLAMVLLVACASWGAGMLRDRFRSSAA